MLKNVKNMPFYREKFVTVRSKRSTVTITVHDGPFSENITIVGSRMEGPDHLSNKRYKNA